MLMIIGSDAFVSDGELKAKEVKLSLCLTKHYARKTYGGVDV
jgi:hypothetical protein